VGRALVAASLVFSLAALGAVVVLAIAGRGADSRPASKLQPVAEHAPIPSKAALRATPARPQSADGDFWRLIAETRRAAGNDTGEQSHLLQDRLTQLSPAAIVAFERTRQRLDRQLYRWDIWGAASVIEDGCSDDCFRDFRAYVISLGRGPYEAALRNPDSLASVVRDAEQGDWENADDVAPDAYASVTGNDFPYEVSDLSGRPAGRALNLDRAALSARYPRLAARFR
jgi:Protein of unknown function (DUF4240)